MYNQYFVRKFRLSATAFTRVRDLLFARLAAFMLNLRKGSTEQELAGLLRPWSNSR
jgi:hypothetical protein